MTYEYKQYLSHHGIKGQKWGVRRYQNEDGTLTAEGKKRYSEADTWSKEESRTLSNEELDRRNTRMQKEQQYRNNIDNRHPTKKEVSGAAKKIFVSTAIGAASAAMTLKYKDKLEKLGKKKVEEATEKAAASTAKKAAAKVTEKAAKKSVGLGRSFIYDNRHLLGLVAGLATSKGTEYWKKKNDEAGKDPTFSDFAYNHRGALGVAAYVAVNKIAKRLYKS